MHFTRIAQDGIQVWGSKLKDDQLPGNNTEAKPMSMRIDVTSNVGAKSEIEAKCMEGGLCP